MKSPAVRSTRAQRSGLTLRDAFSIVMPTVIGVIWAVIAVDLTFVLEIDWALPHGAIATISYVLQAILFWPSAIFTLAARTLPAIGWQPDWSGLTVLAIACGGGPGLLVGLILFSWSRR